MSAHHELSPSAAYRWMACPASVRALREHAQPEPPNYAAAEGTAAHELAMRCLMAGIDPEVGETLQADGFDFTVDDEMADAIREYLQFIARLEVEFGGVARPEQRLTIPPLTRAAGAPVIGTADAVIISPDHARVAVIDLKYGRGDLVSARDNPQLMLYALGARTLAPEAEEFALFICQPRREHVEEAVVTPAALDEFAQYAEDRAVLALSPDAPFVPGAVQCRWCPINAICSAYANAVSEAVSAGFPDIDATSDEQTGEILSRHAEKLDMVKQWVSAVETSLKTTLSQGKRVPGWKLVQGRAGNREWQNVEEVTRILKKSFRLPDRDIYERKLISPTVAEKRIGKKWPARWERLQALVTRAKPSLVVVPEDDPRPAACNDAHADTFPNLEH